MRDRRVICALLAGIVATAPACRRCGLGLHESTPWSGSVSPGALTFRDFPLSPREGEMEIDLSSASFAATTPGTADAFLTETSCAKLFDGPYPGAGPLCTVVIGPTPTGKVSAPVRLDAGTYRVWVQGYSSNPDEIKFQVNVDLWDNSCRAPLQ